MLLRIYQQQVAYSGKAVLLGFQDIQVVLKEIESGSWPVNTDRLWYGVQNLIVGAGNLSKTLWGTGRNETERQRRYSARQPLRDSLLVRDASPLRKVTIRNDYEHLDERIEEWWETSPDHNIADMTIGPRDSFALLGSEKSVMRLLDPTTGEVTFWGNELNIPSIVNEVHRILPIAEAESRKPHWNTNHSTSGGGG